MQKSLLYCTFVIVSCVVEIILLITPVPSSSCIHCSPPHLHYSFPLCKFYFSAVSCNIYLFFYSYQFLTRIHYSHITCIIPPFLISSRSVTTHVSFPLRHQILVSQQKLFTPFPSLHVFRLSVLVLFLSLTKHSFSLLTGTILDVFFFPLLSSLSSFNSSSCFLQSP